MTRWETLNCPWYMDTQRWATPFNQFERSARKTLDQGLIPASVFSSVKEGPEEDVEASAFNVKAATKGTRFYADHSQSRKAKQETQQKPVTSKQSKYLMESYAVAGNVSFSRLHRAPSCSCLDHT